MKIKEFLGESATDIVARFYKESGKDAEARMNPENVKYKDTNNEYYDDHFKEWFDEGVVPVFTKPAKSVDPVYTSKPEQGKLQSPGYRGLQYAKAAAGLPYNHNVQRYEPNVARMVAAQTMDGAKNNNGQ
jgi:hypothetical protein